MKIKKVNILNENIKSRIIKVLDFNSNYLGIFKIEDALKKAKKSKMDLIEISKKEDFSICRIVKFSKFLHSHKKKNEVKKKLKKKKPKEIKFHLFTAILDYSIKINHIIEFLEKGFNVKVTLLIRGRESIKMNIIQEFVDRVIASLKNKGILFKYPNLKERCISMLFFSKN